MQNNEELILEFRKSVSEKNKARLVISGLLLMTVIVFSLIAITVFKGFLVSSVPEITALVSKHLNDNSEQYVRDLNSSAIKIAPVYSREIQTTLKNNWGAIEKSAESELLNLNHYAQKKLPNFQQDLANIAIAQESTIEHELNKILTQEQGKEISENYTNAALATYKDFVRMHFTEHQKVGSNIATNLFKVMQKEPDVTSEVDANEAIGLGLEVVGLQLQELAKK